MKGLRRIFTFLVVTCFCISSYAQKSQALLVLKDSVFNFGYIPEEKGRVQHIFLFENKGDAPLVINKISTDCGCTTTSYTQTAIPPNGEGKIIVAYNPKGRPGTFVKKIRIYSNSKNRVRRAIIKGSVTTLGGAERYSYTHQVGDLRLSASNLYFPIATEEQEYPIRLVMQNASKKTLIVKIDLPPFIKAKRTAFSLEAGEPEELMLYPSLSSAKISKIYRKDAKIIVYTESGKKTEGTINVVLPFLRPTPKMEEGAPRMELDTYVDFGYGEKGEVYSTSLELKNVGRKSLKVYSVFSDNSAIDPTITQSTIPSNRSGFILYTIDMNKVEKQGGKMEANLSILVNDPLAPLRKVKILIKTKK